MFFALSASAFAQVSYHGSVGPIIADLASYSVQQPAIPGMGLTEYSLGISFSSSDPVPQLFNVSVELEFSDGHRYAAVRRVQRAGKDPTVLKLALGDQMPVKIILFSIAAYVFQTPSSLLVAPPPFN